MTSILDAYAGIVDKTAINHLEQLANIIRGKRIVHVNSTRLGGGVAEILEKMIPLMGEFDLDTTWEIITGDETFFQCTKGFHNALQGNRVVVPQRMLDAYEETNRRRAEELRPLLEEADVVFIHDPQPAPLLNLCPNRKGKWIWRCHIDLSHPFRPVWKYLRPYLEGYDASIFSLSAFARSLPHPQYLIPPSIDPLSEKNIDLDESEIREVCNRFQIDVNRPLVVQISRFDRFKDPVGVIQAYRLAKRYISDLQLVLAGGGASDDPEGAIVLQEVQESADNDPDIHVLELPPDSHRLINALQRAADVILQKSVREGFGLTVTEGMWKGKPVIGGDTGGIRLQVINYHTGFLVNTPEGAALRLRYFFEKPEKIKSFGQEAKAFVRENFLLTRQLREYLTVIVALLNGTNDRIELI